MRWCFPLVALFTMSGMCAEAGAAPASASQRLVVTTEEHQALLNVAAPSGSRWCIQWQHSVKHFRVLDCYRNAAGTLQLERSHQPDFAAGLGHVLGRGEQVSDGEGGYWINEINESVPNNRYALRVGALAVNHQVVWPDGEHAVCSLSERVAGQRVTIQLMEARDVLPHDDICQ
ncbi:DUF1850 domain-containing protein [Halomonas sp. BC2]|uniref:DUF1850 domain-containing protein n=1 Tax=Halomonas sp. BC2 TaxID=1670449 RepID=UPI0009BE6B99|nr:DUF1850 domain-containing protein [Halomonas sp. BC2]